VIGGDIGVAAWMATAGLKMRSCQLCVALPEKVPVARGAPPAPSQRCPVTAPELTRYTRMPVMLTLCADVNLTPSSTPVPGRLPSPPAVQQKALVSRENAPQSVGVAVYVGDHNPGALGVSAAVALWVGLSAMSASPLSVISICRTRTAHPLPVHGPRQRSSPSSTSTTPRHVRASVAPCVASVKLLRSDLRVEGGFVSKGEM
jgi:hypothetical protein